MGSYVPVKDKPYKYVPPQRVWILSRFRVKMDKDFAHFGLESGMVSRIYGRVRTYLSFQFQMKKKERETC